MNRPFQEEYLIKGVVSETVTEGYPVGLVQVPVADPGVIHSQLAHPEARTESEVSFIQAGAQEHSLVE